MLQSLGQSLLLNMAIGLTSPRVDQWCVCTHPHVCSEGNACIQKYISQALTTEQGSPAPGDDVRCIGSTLAAILALGLALPPAQHGFCAVQGSHGWAAGRRAHCLPAWAKSEGGQGATSTAAHRQPSRSNICQQAVRSMRRSKRPASLQHVCGQPGMQFVRLCPPCGLRKHLRSWHGAMTLARSQPGPYELVLTCVLCTGTMRSPALLCRWSKSIALLSCHPTGIV